MSGYVHDLPGTEQTTVDITVTLSAGALRRLATGSVACSEVWLTEQPDGKYAIGVVTPERPEKQGLAARAVERDDRKERFPA